MDAAPPRTWLFVPGHQSRRVAKALHSSAEAVIIDLEDGVGPEHKTAARQNAAEALRTAGDRAARCWVRVNRGDEAALRLDLTSLAGQAFGGIVLPKTESQPQVQAVVTLLDRFWNNEASSSLGMIALIESARGLLHLREIACVSDRLVGLMFGGEDYALSAGLYANLRGIHPDLTYARAAIATTAAAYGRQAIDQVCLDLNAPHALVEECRAGCAMGFTGKAVIHPQQIEVVHEVMSPDANDLARARRIVDAFERAMAAGEAAILLDGRLVDRPVVQRARQILTLGDRTREKPIDVP